jgi:hypothetical protein
MLHDGKRVFSMCSSLISFSYKIWIKKLKTCAQNSVGVFGLLLKKIVTCLTRNWKLEKK